MTTLSSGLNRCRRTLLNTNIVPRALEGKASDFSPINSQIVTNSVGILEDILFLMFPVLFIGALFFWLHWKFQSHLWELATEQEVTHGSCEVFPFALGTQEALIKVDEEMLHCWI